ncbi:transposase, partial [Salinibacter sp.]|uniref:transposase n=1 Tax=Salinibacter sp. TaxID=2065818 RepID=UPI003FA7A67F
LRLCEGFPDRLHGDAEDEDPGESEEKNVQYWATNNLEMTEEKREELARRAWGVETYHRRLKQYCGVKRSQCQTLRHNTTAYRCRFEPSCGSNYIEWRRPSASTNRRPRSFGKPSGRISLIQPMFCPQVRNSN